MILNTVNLQSLATRLADRSAQRTEAIVQSDLRMLLLAAGLNLREENLEEVLLESPVSHRRRIDVELGATVFEVKRDLRVGNVRVEAVEQLAGYVKDRVAIAGSRYVGVLTDGVEWHLYHLNVDALELVSSYTLNGFGNLDGLIVWLDGILATVERIAPTPIEIARRLGAGSPAFALDVADLTLIYNRNRGHAGVDMKRTLWSKLLTTALGTSFSNEDSLFIEHTLLVVTAELIGHAVVGFDLGDTTLGPATLVRGQLFAAAQIRGVVEEDFFDWIVEVDGGESFVRVLAQRLGRFAWEDVEHDVMKVLYESIIAATTRKKLGEYYTPDWLAEAVIEDAVSEPLRQRVLDPSCGSGTFLFHSVRKYLAAADLAAIPPAQAIKNVTEHVIGVDVHPVAVTLARVTYLLAIGRTRLTAADRPAFSVPVYLGDSIQWGQNSSLFDSDALVVPTGSGDTLFNDELRFPDRVVENAAVFNGLVTDLADAAARPGRGNARSVLDAAFRRHSIHPDDQAVIAMTYKVLCELHDTGRNHIWSYYLRNLARPIWLARANNRVDVLVGNPPWLSYRFMPPGMKASFRAMSVDRGFWQGASDATHQDLSALFVARAVEQYLKPGGKFAFVMPFAVLSRKQFTGFRSGVWSGGYGDSGASARFDKAWDLHAVKPSFFPVPAAVVRGVRATRALALQDTVESWSGSTGGLNKTLADVEESLIRKDGEISTSGTGRTASSPYAARFLQGATLVPRFLTMVEEAAVGPLGAGGGRQAVKSARSANEKAPWKSLPGHVGNVEKQFVRPIILGEAVLPFTLKDPNLAVIPFDGSTLEMTISRLEQYPGLADWWRSSESIWQQHRTSSLSLLDRLDYQKGLGKQLPTSSHRVVYTKSGMYLAAAYVCDERALVEQQLYWASVSGPDEARYLVGVLNSDALLDLVRPLQSRGEHNPRHFAKYVWQLPIPSFDHANAIHVDLVELSKRAELLVGALELPKRSFQLQRRAVRKALEEAGIAALMNNAVVRLLG